MPNDQRCEPCDRDGLNASTMQVHLKSKAHLDTVALLEDDKLENVWPDNVQKILDEGIADPVECARSLRKVWAQRRWPSRAQPQSVRMALEGAGIPIFDLPYRTITEGEGTKMRHEQLALHQEQF